jgi:hypothetical protein
VKPNITSVEVHPQLSNNRHPVDGALVGASSVWPYSPTLDLYCYNVPLFSVVGLITYPDDIQVIWAGYQILKVQNQIGLAY